VQRQALVYALKLQHIGDYIIINSFLRRPIDVTKKATERCVLTNGMARCCIRLLCPCVTSVVSPDYSPLYLHAIKLRLPLRFTVNCRREQNRKFICHISETTYKYTHSIHCYICNWNHACVAIIEVKFIRVYSSVVISWHSDSRNDDWDITLCISLLSLLLYTAKKCEYVYTVQRRLLLRNRVDS